MLNVFGYNAYKAIGRVTVARNLLSTCMWLMFRIVVWHEKQNINYINVGVFVPCLTIGKWPLLRRILYA